ncbi:MAG TPA: hypothetical protein VFK05_29215 [Polyangiaceae bacterium]|nr:hypothetical protein [Polyangiaceae bacterium]
MIRARGLWLLGLSALLGSACGSERVGPPPSAPSLERPTAAIPADLDLVLRLDLRKMRETLGGPAMTALGEQALLGLRGDDRETDALLLRALEQTDTLWLAVRPTATLSVADSVWVMVGHFPRFDPHRAASTPRFGPALDLGGNLRRYDRPHPALRSAPARIYARGDDLLVSLSEAEIDSVERSLEEQRGMPPLEPAEKGAFSAVARPQALPLSILAGTESLRRVVANANRLELNADLTGSGLDATLALRFEDTLLAEQVARALNEMRAALGADSGRLGRFATRTKIGSAGQYVSLQLALGRDELSELVNCRGSACAW